MTSALVTILNGDVFRKISGSLTYAEYEHTEFEGPGEAGTVYTSDGTEGRIEVDHRLFGLDGAVGAQFVDKTFGAVGEEAFTSPTDTQSLAVFLYETSEWESGLGIEGGLRFEQVEYDNVLNGERSFDLASGSLGIHKHAGNGLFLGAQLSATERAPNETELFANGPHLAVVQFEIGDANLDKELGIHFEGTARLTRDNWMIGINAFHTDFTDFIFLAPGVTILDGVAVDEVDELPVFTTLQQDATFIGAEIYGDIHWGKVLGAQIKTEASMDVVDSELSSGGPVPLQPPTSGRIALEADWPLLSFSTDVTFASDANNTAFGSFPTDGYHLWDAKISAPLPFLSTENASELFVEVRNITDEEARLATSTLRDQLPLPGRNLRRRT